MSSVEGVVREKYGEVAGAGLSSNDAGVNAVAQAFGYSAAELESIPAGANMGLSCGNPTAFATLKPGEVVVDLGCGGGLDVFLAAQKVGSQGKAIGIDMTPQMVDLARRNAAKGADAKPIGNVEFHLANIDELPLADSSVDCIISNCVINLAPDKHRVFREMFRVLKPGGRVSISDIALRRPLPAELASDLLAYVGCIAGAISIGEYEKGLGDAGFGHVHVVPSGSDLGVYAMVEGQSGCCAPPMSSTGLPIVNSGCASDGRGGNDVHRTLKALLARYDVNDYAASVRVYALKGASAK